MAINVSKDRIKLSIGVINPCIVKILLLFFFLSCGGVRRNSAFRKTVTAKAVLSPVFYGEGICERGNVSLCLFGFVFFSICLGWGFFSPESYKLFNHILLIWLFSFMAFCSKLIISYF